MLFLLFRLGEDRYAIEAGRVGELLPMVRIKALPGAPAGVAGLINYRGTPVPVVDLGAMAAGRPAAQRKLSTRIALVRDASPDGASRWIGLILEQATETLRRDPRDFVPVGVGEEGTPLLGPVLPEEGGLIQWIDPGGFMPDALRQHLLPDAEGRG